MQATERKMTREDTTIKSTYIIGLHVYHIEYVSVIKMNLVRNSAGL